MSSFSTTHWVILAALCAIIYSVFKRSGSGIGASNNSMFCKSCGNTGKPSQHTKGSMAIEILLWLCFIVPGLIYSLWRLSSRHQVCSQCGSADLVPGNSPIATAAKKQLGIEA